MLETCQILIVEAETTPAKLLSSLLKNANCKISFVKQGLNVVTHLLKKKFDIVLLADSLPDEDGFRVLRRIRENSGLSEVPVILMLSSIEAINKVFENRGTDYVIKPLVGVQVKARLTPYIQIVNEKIRCKEENFKTEKVVKQLDDAFMEMEVMSRIDPLTLILNRRTFLEKINDEQIRSRRNQYNFSLLLVNIINCRRYNDHHGYDCGDFIIKNVAKYLNGLVRERDFTSRWSGDKFMILLPETDVEGVTIIKKKINDLFNETLFEYKGLQHRVDISFSFKVCTGNDELDDILREIE